MPTLFTGTWDPPNATASAARSTPSYLDPQLGTLLETYCASARKRWSRQPLGSDEEKQRYESTACYLNRMRNVTSVSVTASLNADGTLKPARRAATAGRIGRICTQTRARAADSL